MKASIILGDTNDYHATYMLNACQLANIPAYIFDTATFPSEANLSWHAELSSGELVLKDVSIKFSDIGSVFWSSLNMCGTTVQMETEDHQIAVSDATSMLRTFLEENSFCWVNSWRAFQFHKVKPRQLGLAAKCGIRIPSTYIGNDPKQIHAFVHSRGKCIYKPVYGGALAAEVTPDLLQPEHLKSALKLSPVTVQQYVPGTNIRTYVINGEVYSAEIPTKHTDFRTDEDAIPEAISTPHEIKRQAYRILCAFNMKWTAIDWRRDLSGNYYFLEANPSPMFTFFERCTGYPITERLLHLLKVS